MWSRQYSSNTNRERNREYALRLYTYLVQNALEISQSNKLVHILADAGSIEDAQYVFDRLTPENESSWNALISGCMKHRNNAEFALTLFDRMQKQRSLHLHGHTSVALLKACAKLKDVGTGFKIHAEISKTGLLGKNLFVASSLLDMYARCGLLDKSQKVFDELLDRDVVLWNALITGSINVCCYEHAIACSKRMNMECILPNAVTFICILKASGRLKALARGLQIHCNILEEDILGKEHYVGSALIDFYAKCGLHLNAQEVFNKLPFHGIVLWTTLITAHIESGQVQEALRYLRQMQLEGIAPNSVTYICALKGCIRIGDLETGQEIHTEIERRGLILDNPTVGNIMIDMYAKCGLVAKAQDVFQRLPLRNIVSWTTLISAYANCGNGKEAVKWFEQMQSEGVDVDAVTFVCGLKACGSIGATEKGQKIHEQIERYGLLENNPIVGNALVDMYAKCGSLNMAQEIFNKLENRDAVSWNALISGYTENDLSEEALKCLEKMESSGVPADETTYACSLKACGTIAALKKGQEIHAEIERQGLQKKDVLVGRTLVDMYAKCGAISKGIQVFEKLPDQDVVSWTSIIAGYGQLGESESVFIAFERMVGTGSRPDLVTFVVVLSACSRRGLFSKSERYFEAMSKTFGIIPALEHHTCLADIHGRLGYIDKAMNVIKNMPLYPNMALWHSILGTCKYGGNLEFAKQAFQKAIAPCKNT